MSRGKKWSSARVSAGRGAGGRAGRHVGGALFVNVPAEMTGRWTLRPRPESEHDAIANRFDTCDPHRLLCASTTVTISRFP